jgi:hypothetical protein
MDIEKVSTDFIEVYGGFPRGDARAHLVALFKECLSESQEQVAKWMLDNSFATGHGDTLAGLLGELSWQVKELRARPPER